MDPVAAEIRSRDPGSIKQLKGSWGRPDCLLDDVPRKQDPAVVALREAGGDQPAPHLGTADLEADLGKHPHCLLDDTPDQLGLEDVQAGSHRRSIMPDGWWRLESARVARLRAMDPGRSLVRGRTGRNGPIVAHESDCNSDSTAPDVRSPHSTPRVPGGGPVTHRTRRLRAAVAVLSLVSI